jgi:hypothetical protein
MWKEQQAVGRAITKWGCGGSHGEGEGGASVSRRQGGMRSPAGGLARGKVGSPAVRMHWIIPSPSNFRGVTKGDTKSPGGLADLRGKGWVGKTSVEYLQGGGPAVALTRKGGMSDVACCRRQCRHEGRGRLRREGKSLVGLAHSLWGRRLSGGLGPRARGGRGSNAYCLTTRKRASE